MDLRSANCARLRPRAIIVGVLAIHACLVPIAIAATRLTLGFENALTRLNQATWMPIIGAQGALLAVYLAWGGDGFWRRTLFFLVGSMYVTCSLVWAYTMLCTFPEPKYRDALGYVQLMSLPLVMPSLLTGAGLVPLRAWLGSIQCDHDYRVGQRRFRILDILLLMTMTALATAWFTAIAALPGVAESMNVKSILSRVPFRILDAAGIAILALGDRRRWIGVLLMVGGVALPFALWGWPRNSSAERIIVGYAYAESIALGTLLALRVGGHRLRGVGQPEIDLQLYRR